MKFLIQPVDFWEDLSRLTDQDVLHRLDCGDGKGCCDGTRDCTPKPPSGDEEC